MSILEGGFPSLVAALQSLRGSLEPVIIQHNPEAWEHFLRTTGCNVAELGAADANSKKTSSSINLPSSPSKTREDELARKKLVDMNALERTKTALTVAESLNHEIMAAILRQKIDNLEGRSNLERLPKKEAASSLMTV